MGSKKTQSHKPPFCYSQALLKAIRRQVEEVCCKILDVYEDGTETIKLHTETNKVPI